MFGIYTQDHNYCFCSVCVALMKLNGDMWCHYCHTKYPLYKDYYGCCVAMNDHDKQLQDKEW